MAYSGDNELLMTKLTLEIVENANDEELQELLLLSKDILGQETYNSLQSKPCRYRFLTELKSRLKPEEFSLIMKKLMQLTDQHGRSGTVNFAEAIQLFLEEKEKPKTKTSLIGRQSVFDKVLRYFDSGYFDSGQRQRIPKGLVVYGDSGIGKTSLANEVCLALKQRKWTIHVVDQREKYELRELLHDLICILLTDNRARLQVRYNSDVEDLTTMFLSKLREFKSMQQGTVLYLDNVDGHCDSEAKQEAFLDLLMKVLGEIDTTVQIIVVVTVGKKLLEPGEVVEDTEEFKLEFVKSQVVEVGLKPLSEDYCLQLCHRKWEKLQPKVSDEDCKKIVSICKGMPFTLQLVTSLLRTEYDVLEFLNSVGSCEPVSALLQKFYSVQEEKVCLLQYFMVFQTAVYDAVAVEEFVRSTENKFMKEKFDGYLLDPELCSLIEKNTFVELMQESTESDRYSLHPIVYETLVEDFTDNVSMKVVREQFLKHVSEMMAECGKDVSEAFKVIEKNWVNFRYFFSTVNTEKKLCRNIVEQRNPVMCTMQRILNVSDLILNCSERKDFARIQAKLEKESSNLFGYVYWSAVEAENLQMEGHTLSAREMIDDIASELGMTVGNDVSFTRADGWGGMSDEEVPAIATFCKIRARIIWIQGRYQKATEELSTALADLTLAENFLKGKISRIKTKAKMFKKDLSDIKNLKGCIYFQLKEFESAIECHTEALESIGYKHHSYIDYKANLAACYYQQAIGLSEQTKRAEKLGEALKTYDKLVEDNKTFGFEWSVSQAGLLRNRAEIYNVQKRYEDAVKDAKFVLDVLEKRFSEQHVEVLLAKERLACFLCSLGRKEMEQKGNYREHLEESMQIYDRLLAHFLEKLEATEHLCRSYINRTKGNHLKLLEELAQKNVDDIRHKYTELENRLQTLREKENTGTGTVQDLAGIFSREDTDNVADPELHSDTMDVDSSSGSVGFVGGNADDKTEATMMDSDFVPDTVQEGSDIATASGSKPSVSVRHKLRRQHEVELTVFEEFDEMGVRNPSVSDVRSTCEGEFESQKSAENPREMLVSYGSRSDSGRGSLSTDRSSQSLSDITTSSSTSWSQSWRAHKQSESQSSQDVFASIESDDGSFREEVKRMSRLESQQSLTSAVGRFSIGSSDCGLSQVTDMSDIGQASSKDEADVNVHEPVKKLRKTE